MKIKVMITAIAVMLGSLFITGCTPQQQAAVAKQLGLASAVTWIGIDNPAAENLTAVKGVVDVIAKACSTNGITDASYYARIYPVADKYITDNLQANQQPMARLGASFILTSLDTAFAMNPKWGENVGTASMIVAAYCDGAKAGLSMSATDPVRVAACRQAAVRAAYKR